MEKEFEKIFLEIFNKYKYLNLDKNEVLKWKKYFLENISCEDLEMRTKKIIKDLDSLVLNQLQENEYQIINNYINFIYTENRNESAFNSLKKIGDFFNKYKIGLSISSLSELLSNNNNLYNLVQQYTDMNLDKIKTKNETLNRNIKYIIEIYCDDNNIEVNSEEFESTSSVDNSLEGYYQEIKKLPLLTFRKEQEILKKIKNVDKEAYDYFIKHNIKLVFKYASQYACPEVDYEDLIQEGIMGLMKAMEKFDPEKKCKFSTYAKWWIERYMSYYVYMNKKSLRLPRHMMIKIRNYKRVKDELEKELCHEVTPYDVAGVLEIPETKAFQIESLMNDVIRLNDIVDEDSEQNTELIDFIPANDEQIDGMVIDKILADEVKNIIDDLDVSDRDKQLFSLRFGINDGQFRSLGEVGKIFNLTRERVRQIEATLIKKINAKLNWTNTKTQPIQTSVKSQNTDDSHSINIEDIKNIINMLKDEIPREFYLKISQEERIMLGFKIINKDKIVTSESLAKFLNVNEEYIDKITIEVLNKYRDYLNNLNNKVKRK